MEEVHELIDQMVAGNQRAWQRFFILVAPEVEAIIRRSRVMGSLRHQVDDTRDVMARVFERLRRDDHRALRLYREWQKRNDRRGFTDWLTVVSTNVARDYVEERMGGRDQPHRRLMTTLAGVLDDDDDALAVGAHITPKLVAAEIMALAREELSAEQLEILNDWLGGDELSADGRRKLRAGLARLRRRLAGAPTSAADGDPA